MRTKGNILLLAVDYVFVPLVIFILLYEPHYADGLLLHLEAGEHLGTINDLMHGKVLFRDVFSIYGPINDVLPLVAMKLFGTTFEVLRAYFHYTTIIGTIVAYFLARMVLKTRLFAYIAVLVITIETFHPFWSSRWGGMRAGSGLFVLLAMIKSYDSEKRRRWLYAAGLASVFALLNSTEIGVFATFAAVAYTVSRSYMEGAGMRAAFRYLSPYAAGFATLMVPFLLYYFVAGALGGYLRFTFFEFPFNHVSKFSQGNIPPLIPKGLTLSNLPSWVLSYDFKVYLPDVVYVLTALYLAASFLAKTPVEKRDALVLIALLCYGIPLYLAAFRAITGPQFSSSIAPAILIGCIFLERIYLDIRESVSMSVWRSATGFGKLTSFLTVLFLSGFYMVFSDNRILGSGKEWVHYEVYKFAHYHSRDPNMDPLMIERAGNVHLPAAQASVVRGVVKYILSHTDPDEPIFVLPDMGSYYFLTGRPNFTQFPVAEQAWYNQKYYTRLLRDVREHAPRYVILETTNSFLATSIRKADYDLLPELFRYCFDNYRVEASFGSTLILRHN